MKEFNKFPVFSLSCSIGHLWKYYRDFFVNSVMCAVGISLHNSPYWGYTEPSRVSVILVAVYLTVLILHGAASIAHSHFAQSLRFYRSQLEAIRKDRELRNHE